MRQGDKGTVFVSALFVAGKTYAVTDKGGKRLGYTPAMNETLAGISSTGLEGLACYLANVPRVVP